MQKSFFLVTMLVSTLTLAAAPVALAQSDPTALQKKYVEVPGYPAPHSPYSHAVVANGFGFVSGQIPVRPGGGPTEVVGTTMQEQTRQCLRNVQMIREAAGSSLDRVVKVTVLLARPELYKEMNEAYVEFFPGPKPARTMVRFGADIPAFWSPSRRSH
jgi:2-iminobutanoate/2-iminopropanoate deaminase